MGLPGGAILAAAHPGGDSRVMPSVRVSGVAGMLGHLTLGPREFTADPTLCSRQRPGAPSHVHPWEMAGRVRTCGSLTLLALASDLTGAVAAAHS